MCKTAGADACGTQTLSSNTVVVQTCTVINGDLTVCSLDALRVAPRKQAVLDSPPPLLPHAQIDMGGDVELLNLRNVTGNVE
eukprot:scaffold16158_cov135-Isochrysis_galbana.AAC.1